MTHPAHPAEFAPAAPPSDATRCVPPWAATVAAAVFFVAIAALIYWFIGGSFTGTTSFIPDPNHSAQVRRGPFRGNADGVTPLPNNGGYFVRSGQAQIVVIPPGANQKRPTNFRFRYDPSAILTPEQLHLALGVRKTDDAQWAKTLAITPDQQSRLGRLRPIEMEIASADRDKLIAAWNTYEQAKDKTSSEKTLVALLKDAAARALPATKAKATQRVVEFTQILSPDQVRELTKLGAGEKVTPITTAPKPAPAP